VPDRIATALEGVVALEPTVHGDDRGFLVETFSEPAWRQAGVEGPFVQENHSRSTRRGTLRGMHFQTEPGQGKLVRCARGAIYDVAVDLRRGSPTYGQWEGHLLDDDRHRQLWVPIGFAHGFQVVSEVADVAYKLTSLYDPRAEAEIAWDDPEVGIEWPIPDPVLSERDRSAPRLAEIAESLPFAT
jgi:dTDP-4-dehydrorhamnose 3,5-epimerase